MPDVFINYRTGDAHDAATAIERDLSHRFGTEQVFFAGKSIKPSEDYRDALVRAVQSCKVLLAVIGPKWLDHDPQGHSPLDDPEDWIRREIIEAFESGVHVIPVLVGRGLKPLTPADLPEALASLAHCQYQRLDHREAEHTLDRLSRIITELAPGLMDRSTVNSDVQKLEGDNNTSNSIQSSTVHGNSVQTRDYTDNHTYNQHGGIGTVNGGFSGTMINGPSGPVNTGSGNQYNALPDKTGFGWGGEE